MRGKNRKPIASCLKLPQFTTMNVIDGQAGPIVYASLIFYSLTIDNILNIIVLLILAAVSIATLTGDNGILTKATTSAERSKRAGALEKVQVEVAGAIGEDLKVDMSLLKENLKKNLGLTDGDITENLDGSITVPVDGYLITVETNGEVHEGEKELKKVEGSSSDWELNEAKDTIVKYIGDGFDGDTIVIPNCVDGNRIVGICGNGSSAGMDLNSSIFVDKQDIIQNKKLEISNGIEIIGDGVFANCSELSGDIIIPNTVTEIGYGAFYNCSGLTGDLVIPSSVTTLDTSGAGCFRGSGFQGTLTIGMENIPTGCFAVGLNFTKLILEDTVKVIEDGAFNGCSKLTGELKLPEGLTKIGVAFTGCSGFTGDLIIPDGITTISGGTFARMHRFNWKFNNSKQCNIITSRSFFNYRISRNINNRNT